MIAPLPHRNKPNRPELAFSSRPPPRNPVISLAAHGLQHRRTHTRLACQQPHVDEPCCSAFLHRNTLGADPAPREVMRVFNSRPACTLVECSSFRRETNVHHGRVVRTAMEKALAGLLTNRVWMSLSVKRAARKAGMKAANTVSNGRKVPPSGSPTWYQPAS